MSEQKQHILFVQPSLEGAGGIEKVVPTAAKELRRLGYTVSTAILYKAVPKEQTYWRSSFAFKETPTKSIYHRLYKVWQRILFLKRTIKSAKPDIVIVSAQGVSLITLFAKYLHLFSTPTIVYVHESVDVSGSLYLALMKFLYRYADGFVCVSKGIQAEIVKEFKIKKQITAVAYNSIPVRENIPVPDFNFDKYQKPFLVTASRLEKIRGLDVLVEYFIEYAQTEKGTLFILGTGSLEKNIKKQIEENDLNQRIVLLGYHEHAPDFIAGCDVYVSCAQREAFGVSLLESLAAGVPVVATDVPYGPREILAPKEVGNSINCYPYYTRYGTLFSEYPKKGACGSSSALNLFAEAIKITLENKFDKNKLRTRAHFFSVENQVTPIQELIQKVTI